MSNRVNSTKLESFLIRWNEDRTKPNIKKFKLNNRSLKLYLENGKQHNITLAMIG